MSAHCQLFHHIQWTAHYMERMYAWHIDKYRCYSLAGGAPPVTMSHTIYTLCKIILRFLQHTLSTYIMYFKACSKSKKLIELISRIERHSDIWSLNNSTLGIRLSWRVSRKGCPNLDGSTAWLPDQQKNQKEQVNTKELGKRCTAWLHLTNHRINCQSHTD